MHLDEWATQIYIVTRTEDMAFTNEEKRRKCLKPEICTLLLLIWWELISVEVDFVKIDFVGVDFMDGHDHTLQTYFSATLPMY